MEVSDNKRVAKNTLFLYGRMLLSLFISLYTARVVLNTLGASDFGLYNVVCGVIAVFGVLKALISTGTQRFLTFEMGKGSGVERLTAVFTTSLSIFVIIGGVIFVLGETVGLWFVNTYLKIPEGREFAANVIYQVSILAMFVSVIQLPYSAAIMSHERMDIYGYVGVGEPLLRLVLILLLPILPFDKLITYAIMVFIISGSVTLVYFILCNRLFEECKFRLRIDKPLFRSMIGFTMWNMLESISGMLNRQGLDILINIFFGTTVNASRAVANQVNNAVHGFASNFLIALFPQITKTYASKEYNNCCNLMIRGAKFSYIILAILMIPLSINLDFILVLWLKTPPHEAAIFSRLIFIALIVSMVSEPLYTGIQATGHVKKYQIWRSSITLLNIPICYVLYKLGLPSYTAFCLSIVVAIVTVVCRAIFLKKELPVFPMGEYAKCVLIKCFGVTLLAYVPLYFLNGLFAQTIGNLIIITVLAVLWSGSLFLLLSVTKNEKKVIFDFVRSKLRFRVKGNC